MVTKISLGKQETMSFHARLRLKRWSQPHHHFGVLQLIVEAVIIIFLLQQDLMNKRKRRSTIVSLKYKLPGRVRFFASLEISATKRIVAILNTYQQLKLSKRLKKNRTEDLETDISDRFQVLPQILFLNYIQIDIQEERLPPTKYNLRTEFLLLKSSSVMKM